MRSYWIRVDPNPMTGVLTRVGTDTLRKGHVMTGRNCGDAATSQGTIMIAGNRQKLEEVMKTLPSDFYPPELRE